jgi:hypothetical protein
MKSAFLASLVLVATTAGAALAGEPMVLTNAQLDRVTAGASLPASLTAVVAATDSGALPADRIFFNFNYHENAPVTATEPHRDTAPERMSALRHVRLIGY